MSKLLVEGREQIRSALDYFDQKIIEYKQIKNGDQQIYQLMWNYRNNTLRPWREIAYFEDIPINEEGETQFHNGILDACNFIDKEIDRVKQEFGNSK